MISYLTLALVLVTGLGVTITMARRTKAVSANGLSIEAIAQIAKVVAKEVAEEIVSKLPRGAGIGYKVTEAEQDGIVMDESVIPIAVNIEVQDSNVESGIDTETTVDTGLEKSKNKLASILGNRSNK